MMVKCKECDAQISSEADACPRCGKRRKHSAVFWALVVVAVILLLANLS